MALLIVMHLMRKIILNMRSFTKLNLSKSMHNIMRARAHTHTHTHTHTHHTHKIYSNSYTVLYIQPQHKVHSYVGRMSLIILLKQSELRVPESYITEMSTFRYYCCLGTSIGCTKFMLTIIMLMTCG